MRVGVRSASDIDADTLRLNSAYYLSTDQITFDLLKRWRESSMRVGELAETYKGNIFRRVFVDGEEFSRPYVSASDLDRSDYWGCRRVSLIHGARLDDLALKKGMTVVTRSGVNLGWGVVVRSDLDGVVGSDDLIRVLPRSSEDGGYLGAFLCSRAGRVAIRRFTYATSIKHIEPEHVAEVRVPWPDGPVRQEIGGGYEAAAERRSRSASLINEATQVVFSSVGLRDLEVGEWAGLGRDLGFSSLPTSRSLRGWNHSPRARGLLANLLAVENCSLGSLAIALRKGPSFSRVNADPPHAVQLIGQRQLFRYVPDGRLVSRAHMPAAAFCEPGTILVASVGTFGEAEVFCRAQYVSPGTSDRAYSNHVLRVVVDAEMSAWVYAFLRSRTAFRCLRSFATGSKQQDLHPEMLSELPVPIGSQAAQRKVGKLIQEAFRLRDEASQIEEAAQATLMDVLGERVD